MRSRRHRLPSKSRTQGAIARLKLGFGDAGEHVCVEHYSLPIGTDIAPLLQQFGGPRSGMSYLGYVIEGGLSLTDRDGTTGTIEPGELFCVTSSQSVWIQQNSAVLLFTPRYAQIELVPMPLQTSKYRH